MEEDLEGLGVRREDDKLGGGGGGDGRTRGERDDDASSAFSANELGQNRGRGESAFAGETHRSLLDDVQDGDGELRVREGLRLGVDLGHFP